MKVKLFRRVFVVGLVLHHLVSFAQSGSFTNYSVEDGLAQSQVFAIEEGHNGYLWLGTRGGGLCRFDGIEFTTYTKQLGLSSNYILSLHHSSCNTLWVGTSSGLSRIKGAQVTSVSSLDSNFNTMIIGAITEDKQGIVWLGTNHGLYFTTESGFGKHDLKPEEYGNAISCIQFHKGSMLVAGDNGLISINSKQNLRLTTKDGLTSNQIRSIAICSTGNVWLGTYGFGVSIVSEDKVIMVKGMEELDRSIIHNIMPDTTGDMWISTVDKGLVKWNVADSSLQFFTEKEGLSNNHVRTTMYDTWGNLWIGTSGGGLNKYAGQQFEKYNGSIHNLSGNYIYSIEEGKNNKLWIGTSGKGVDVLLNNNAINFSSDSGFTSVKVKSILCACDSSIWLGTEGNGLYRFKNDTFISQDNRRGIGSTWIKAIDEDSTGGIWVGTAGAGICQITIQDSAVEYTRYSTKDGLKSGRISTVLCDNKGKVWYSYQSGGIGYIVEGEVVNLRDARLPDNPIRSMALGRQNKVWLGTAGQGVYSVSLQADTIVVNSFTTNDGLSSDNIYLMAFDQQSNLWIGTEKGIDRLLTDEEGSPIEVQYYGVDEGFSGVETTRNSIVVTADGAVWIGTINGLFKYTAGSEIKNSTPPFLRIKEVLVHYKTLDDTKYALSRNETGDLDKILLFDYSDNHISFEFQGVVLTYPKQVEYKWKLDGLENKWSPPSKNRSITYSNLPPGNYTFMVLSKNEDDVWNINPQVVVFEILTPIWLTNWFKYLSVGLIVLLLSIITRSRLAIVKKKAKAKQELLQMENDMLVLQQKALRLQMNPHFIFNCLNTIQNMIVKQDGKTARYYLAKFSKLMRKTLDNSRVERITIDDEIETLENYLAIEKFCNEDHFDYKIHVDDSIATDFIEIPSMIIQPFVENAIVHGVGNRSEGGLITVSFKLNDRAIECTISDNGVGRKKASEINRSKGQQHKSAALDITQERLQKLDGKGSRSRIEIDDIISNSSQVVGTKVVVSIPYNG
ncbi:MAG: histidine kinase [Flavobacteriales bacterium]|nr:histidine kinase [Flavobacteriales bacterium]